MKTFVILLATIIPILFLNGCMMVAVSPGGSGITLTGEHTQDTVYVGSFEHLVITVPFYVSVHHSDLDYVTIDADIASAQNIAIEKIDDTLFVGMSGVSGFGFFGPPHLQPVAVITLGSSSLQSITATGAATVLGYGVFYVDNMQLTLSAASSGRFEIEATNLDINVIGASTINVQGFVQNLYANATGASTARLNNLAANDATLSAMGASTITGLYVLDSLEADATGASTIRYSGDAIAVYRATGASTISR